MKCPYYQGYPVIRCCAFLNGLKVPTKLEQERFCCKGSMNSKCPTYLKKEKDLNRVAA